jgi:hypothetical protein
LLVSAVASRFKERWLFAVVLNINNAMDWEHLEGGYAIEPTIKRHRQRFAYRE